MSLIQTPTMKRQLKDDLAIQKPAAAPLLIGQRLSAMAASLAGKGSAVEVETLRTQLAIVTGERDALRDEIAELSMALIEANTRRLAAESAATDFEAKVARSSIDLVASAGVPLSELPAAEATGTSSGVPATREELEKKMAGLSAGDAVKLLREFNATHGNK